jgi:hypothetical protein
LSDPVRADVNIRHAHGKTFVPWGYIPGPDGKINYLATPKKVKAKKPCLHPLYPMNKPFAEDESNEKGFLLCRGKYFLHRTHVNIVIIETVSSSSD